MATNEKAGHSERSAILRFFLKHPMVGPIGSAASVISLLGVEMGSGFWSGIIARPAGHVALL